MNFSEASGKPFVDQRPYLGGWVRVLSGGVAAGPEIIISHGLRTIPRGLLFFDSGKSFTPLWKRGPTLWNTTNIYIILSTAVSATDKLTVFII